MIPWKQISKIVGQGARNIARANCIPDPSRDSESERGPVIVMEHLDKVARDVSARPKNIDDLVEQFKQTAPHYNDCALPGVVNKRISVKSCAAYRRGLNTMFLDASDSAWGGLYCAECDHSKDTTDTTPLTSSKKDRARRSLEHTKTFHRLAPTLGGYLTVGHASDILGLSHHTIYKLCRKGELEYQRVDVSVNSTRWLVAAESVDAFKSRQSV